MVTLVDDKGVLGDGGGVNVVGVEEIDELGFGGRGGLGWGKAEIESGSS